MGYKIHKLEVHQRIQRMSCYEYKECHVIESGNILFDVS